MRVGSGKPLVEVLCGVCAVENQVFATVVHAVIADAAAACHVVQHRVGNNVDAGGVAGANHGRELRASAHV